MAFPPFLIKQLYCCHYLICGNGIPQEGADDCWVGEFIVLCIRTCYDEIYEKTAGYTWTDYKTNTQAAKELDITSLLDKLQEYRRNLLQHIDKKPHNRLPRIIKNY
jgi:hypothetical protein